MLIVVDPHSGVPVYRQIVEQVEFQVAAGQAGPGSELPSTRALSRDLGVNPMTVSRAYSMLEAMGVVVRRPGLPLVVSETAAGAADGRLGQLRSLLEPVARAAAQLGLTEEEAVAEFRAVLETQAATAGRGEDSNGSG
ncbi:MAG TPA: GntR family transcriptional regulator [Longimicrobiales bacterium]|nr:GntR family transcriptional regulator [Longimicrobiales bacterium]